MPEAQRAGLAGGAAAVDARDDVEAVLELEDAGTGSFTSCWCTLFGK